MGLVGDDWLLIRDASRQGSSVFFPTGYHYNPIPKVLLLAVHNAFGIQSISYHAVALALVWLTSVFLLLLAWELTERIAVGVLAGVLFCAFGSHYEAIAWGVVAFWYTTAAITYLLGVIFYIRSHDSRIASLHQRWSYLGFLIALILAPLCHELGITLIGACALYRVTVLEKWSELDRQKKRQMVVGWTRDFSIPSALVLSYLGFKWYLGRETGVSQVPGLSASLDQLTYTASQGVFRAFVPGAGPHELNDLLNHPLGIWQERTGDVLLSNSVAVFGCMLVGLVLLLWRLQPVPRFLILWVLMQCIATTVGLAAIQPRHLYLIAMPSAIFWAIILLSLVMQTQRVLERVACSWPGTQYLRFLPTAVGSSLLVFLGAHYGVEQLTSWHVAADQVDEVIAQVDRLTEQSDPNSRLYLINLPDHTRSPSAEMLWMFRNAARASIELSMPGRFVDVVPFRTTTVPAWADPVSISTTEQLEQLQSQPLTVLLEYENARASVRLWKPAAQLFEELQPVPRSTAAFIDSVGNVMVERPQVEPLVLASSDSVHVSGWAVDKPRDTLASAVFVTLDDRLQYSAQYGLPRPDVADYFGDPALAFSGYEVVIPGEDLTQGRHTLKIKVVSSDGLSYYNIAEPWQRVDIEIR